MSSANTFKLYFTDKLTLFCSYIALVYMFDAICSKVQIQIFLYSSNYNSSYSYIFVITIFLS